MTTTFKLRDLKPGQVYSLHRSLAETPDPVALFARLCEKGRRPDTLLLESADSSNKRPQRSIILHRAAVRITASATAVRLDALSENGRCAMAGIRARLNTQRIQREHPDQLEIAYERPPEDLSAKERLRTAGVLDPIRALAGGFQLRCPSLSDAFLCAGVFAYDLVDAFESLPAAKAGEGAFPHYMFWLAQSLVRIDHERGRTDVIHHVFGADDHPTVTRSYHEGTKELSATVDACLSQSHPRAPTPQVAQVQRPEPTSARPNTDTPEVQPDRHDRKKWAPARTDLDDEAFADVVRTLKQHIVGGDVFQVVPSRNFRLPCSDPLAAYARLRSSNPSPYMFFVSAPGQQLFGASPESALRVDVQADGHKTVSVRPIAGTRGRGRLPNAAIDPELDNRIEAELRLHEKEVAEHMMLVDLARNDLAQISEPGTRRVEQLLGVERYAHVMHLVSRVTGRLRGDHDALHAYRATLNMGTLVGAPKVRAAQLLRSYEETARGPYGGAVGYFTHEGALDTAIIIRSAWVRDGHAQVRAGAGVVYDSCPIAEAEETRRKAQAVLEALEAPTLTGERA